MCSENPDSDRVLTRFHTALSGVPSVPSAESVEQEYVANSIPDLIQTGPETHAAPYAVAGHEDELQVRKQRAAEMEASVTPIARGLYRVISGSGSEYIVDLDGYVDGEERGICTCNDYRYRCGPEGYDCKHILFVKRFIREGLLPPCSTDPTKWLRDRLEYLEHVIEKQHESVESAVRQQELEKLQQRIEQMAANPYEREYRELILDVIRVFTGDPIDTLPSHW